MNLWIASQCHLPTSLISHFPLARRFFTEVALILPVGLHAARQRTTRCAPLYNQVGAAKADGITVRNEWL